VAALHKHTLHKHLMIASVVAIVAGALSTLSLSPFEFWPAAPLSLYLFIHLLQTDHLGKATLLGWLYGVGMFGTGSSWVYVSIHVHGYAPVPLALLLTTLWTMALALLPALFAFSYVRFVAPHRGAILFGFPALSVLFEWLRSWLLTGFPWLYLGYSGIDTWLAGWAPIGGVYLLSLAISFSAAGIFLICHQTNNSIRSIAAAIVATLWLGGLALSEIEWTSSESRQELKIGIVQANIRQQLKWQPAYYDTTLDIYQQMTNRLKNKDIIIWPEAAIPNYYQNAQEFLLPIAENLEQQDTTLITGIPFINKANGDIKIHNSIAAMGNGSGIYHKQRLVPFGEYVPMESLLRGLIQFFDLPMSSFSPGEPDQALLKAGKYLAAPFICYEIVYPDLVREFARQADFLITVSNDSWFGASIGPLQHLQMARMRALENGRYLIRSTNNGISAVINPDGSIQSQSKQFVAQTLSGHIHAVDGHTPFSGTGSLPVLAFCAVALAGLVLKKRVQKKV
jgi:apolipoprotein N-acyltransferase